MITFSRVVVYSLAYATFGTTLGTTANKLRPQLPVSATNPLYLYAHFQDDDQADLRLSYSLDSATTWRAVNEHGSFKGTQLRDPSVMYVPNQDPLLTGMFYFLATPASGTQIQFFSSKDLVNFSPITLIDIGSMVPEATFTWAPEWYVDGKTGSSYFFFSLSTDRRGATSTTAAMNPYFVQFDVTTASVVGTPSPVSLTGTSQGRTFDYFPFFDGTQYYLVYVDQQAGGTGGNVTQPIAYATSEYLAGPYKQQTLQGTDYFGLGSFQTEAPTIIKLGLSGCIRLVFDTWTNPANGRRKYTPVYRDSCLSAGALFSQTSLVNGPSPLGIPDSEHGTIIQLTDGPAAALVFNASSQSAPVVSLH